MNVTTSTSASSKTTTERVRNAFITANSKRTMPITTLPKNIRTNLTTCRQIDKKWTKHLITSLLWAVSYSKNIAKLWTTKWDKRSSSTWRRLANGNLTISKAITVALAPAPPWPITQDKAGSTNNATVAWVSHRHVSFMCRRWLPA